MSSIFNCCSDEEEDLKAVDCIANLTLPVPPGTQAGTRYIVTNTSGMVHPTWINLPAGLGENDIIEKDYQNLNWKLRLDISEQPFDGGGIILYVDCRCHNYWYDSCNSEWKEISACSFWGDIEPENFCVDFDFRTTFTLNSISERPDKSVLTVNGIDYVYGQNYTISGTTLTWLDDPFHLECGDLIEIRYC